MFIENFWFAEDNEEYADRSRGLEFIFGNVDNSGDLDADYLNEVIIIAFTLSVCS